MVPDACFNRSDPIIIGLNVVEGILKPGTPLCVPDRDRLRLGTVVSIEANKKPIQSARAATGSVAVKIANEGSVAYGRHFDDKGDIVSLITRESIDILKLHFRDEMTDADWRTCIKLKKLFDIA
jgi:translation initiation factor 5B